MYWVSLRMTLPTYERQKPVNVFFIISFAVSSRHLQLKVSTNHSKLVAFHDVQVSNYRWNFNVTENDTSIILASTTWILFTADPYKLNACSFVHKYCTCYHDKVDSETFCLCNYCTNQITHISSAIDSPVAHFHRIKVSFIQYYFKITKHTCKYSLWQPTQLENYKNQLEPNVISFAKPSLTAWTF